MVIQHIQHILVGINIDKYVWYMLVYDIVGGRGRRGCYSFSF